MNGLWFVWTPLILCYIFINQFGILNYIFMRRRSVLYFYVFFVLAGSMFARKYYTEEHDISCDRHNAETYIHNLFSYVTTISVNSTSSPSAINHIYSGLPENLSSRRRHGSSQTASPQSPQTSSSTIVSPISSSYSEAANQQSNNSSIPTIPIQITHDNDTSQEQMNDNCNTVEVRQYNSTYTTQESTSAYRIVKVDEGNNTYRDLPVPHHANSSYYPWGDIVFGRFGGEERV